MVHQECIIKSIGQILGMMNGKISREIDGNNCIIGGRVIDFIHMETMYQNLGHTYICQKTSVTSLITSVPINPVCVNMTEYVYRFYVA